MNELRGIDQSFCGQLISAGWQERLPCLKPVPSHCTEPEICSMLVFPDRPEHVPQRVSCNQAVYDII